MKVPLDHSPVLYSVVQLYTQNFIAWTFFPLYIDMFIKYSYEIVDCRTVAILLSDPGSFSVNELHAALAAWATLHKSG